MDAPRLVQTFTVWEQKNLTVVDMLYNYFANGDNWIFICFSNIICLISLWLFTNIPDITGNFCVINGFFIGFIKSHTALGITCTFSKASLSIGFTMCFNFHLIRVELCRRTTSNSFVYLINFIQAVYFPFQRYLFYFQAY